MPADRGREQGILFRSGPMAAALLMLWSAACTTASAPSVPAAPTEAARASPVVATMARPTAIPSPSPLALPTFDLTALALTPSRQPSVTSTMEPKQAFHVWLDWSLGPTGRQTTKLKDVAYGRYEPGDVVVEWWIDKWWTDERWWTSEPPLPDQLKGTARLDATTILQAMAGMRVEHTSAVLRGYLLSDGVQRNSDQARLMVSLTYYEATIDRLDFDAHEYLLADRVYELADRSWIAPEFR